MQVGPPTPPPLFSTPAPIRTPAAQPPTSERSVLAAGIASANDRAKALGGTLGAAIVDLGTGAVADVNGDVSMPMQSVQKLLVAMVTYIAVDRGAVSLDADVTIGPADLVQHVSPIADRFARRKTYSVDELLSAMLVDSDNTAAKALTRVLGGIDVLNADIRDLGFTTILADADGNGVATPNALVRALTELNDGHLLRASSRSALVTTLESVQTFPGRLRAGFPAKAKLAHKTGTSQTIDGVTDATNDVGIAFLRGHTMIVVAMLHGARGSDADRDAVLAAVAQAASDAAATFNP